MTDRARDLYATLGVIPSASTEEINAAYRKLARRHHPDVTASATAEQRMSEINAARDVLSDPDRRAAYDRERAGAPRPGWLYGETEDEDLVGAAFAEVLRQHAPGGQRAPRLRLPLRALVVGGHLRSRAGKVFDVPAGTAPGALLTASDGTRARVQIDLPEPFQVALDGRLVAVIGVWPSELVAGSERTLDHPDGEGPLSVRIPAGSQPPLTLIARGRGVPNAWGERGDLIVSVDAVYPRTPDAATVRAASALTRTLGAAKRRAT